MIQNPQREDLFFDLYSFSSLFFRQDWSNYFGDVEHTEIANSLSHDHISFSDNTSFYVLYCSFINQKPSGAITFGNYKATPKILLEATIFDNCSSTDRGGSVNIDCNGEIIQERICYHKSISSREIHVYRCEAKKKITEII